MIDRSCYSCRWFEPSDPEVLEGECRVNPPRLAGMAAPHGNITHQDPKAAMWPTVRRDDWCGAYVAPFVPMDDSEVPF